MNNPYLFPSVMGAVTFVLSLWVITMIVSRNWKRGGWKLKRDPQWIDSPSGAPPLPVPGEKYRIVRPGEDRHNPSPFAHELAMRVGVVDVTIVDVKSGWVLYEYKYGTRSDAPISVFRECFVRVEPAP